MKYSPPIEGLNKFGINPSIGDRLNKTFVTNWNGGEFHGHCPDNLVAIKLWSSSAQVTGKIAVQILFFVF